MYPVLFKIGPLTIYSLGLLWALAAFVAGCIVRLELRRYGYDPEIAASVVFAAAIAGLLGARLFFILEEWNTFTRAPFDFIFIPHAPRRARPAGVARGHGAGVVQAAWHDPVRVA
jgi:phosphatidylglycerol---prolipoprotein diacylglyceryl transferase